MTAIQRCINSLVHACQCRDANCRSPSCQKMKRVVSHTRQCKRKSNGCPICKQLLALCCYHAKVCQEAKCPVHFCQHIKQKLRQQQLQQRLQEAAMMRRRMAQMNARMNQSSMNDSNHQPQKPVHQMVILFHLLADKHSFNAVGIVPFECNGNTVLWGRFSYPCNGNSVLWGRFFYPWPLQL